MLKIYTCEEFNSTDIDQTDLQYEVIEISDAEFEKKFPHLRSKTMVFMDGTFFGSLNTLEQFIKKYQYVHSKN